ncbi:MAG TPA: SUF system NifU family Fe-S cluster assembly protein [Candidatus Hydrogenedentes bacterium]|nr:SUF system NifU family Fe-S cluster assembly protein [Candidatus Hydrogenedentota bacterium]HNT87937.1 SUF system NifU family Fe-S cluster assembly protein [Candidatus Hydrogenedentota bacterium]
MSGSRALYEQVILDHNKNPRNFKVIEDADRKIEGFNPLCGDHFTVFLKLDGTTISDIGIQGAGCAIAKSSASIMSSILKGKSVDEAKELFDRFHAMVTSAPDAPLDEAALGKLAVFSGVREYPIRIKCATLAWHALLAALQGENQQVSTE